MNTSDRVYSSEPCVLCRRCVSHPQRVVLLAQVGQDVRVQERRLQKVAPQRSELRAQMADIATDLLSHLLLALLQLRARLWLRGNLS